MGKLKAFLSVIIMISAVAYLIYAPPYILENVNRNPTVEWRSGEKEPYTGIIKVWCIVDFKMYSGSMSSLTESAAKHVESKHSGVYIKTDSMSADEYRDKTQHGERADIYLFPLGLEYADKYKTLDSTKLCEEYFNINDALKKSGMSGENIKAIPILYSGYAICVDSERITKNGGAIPEEITGESLNALAEKLKTDGSEKVICGNKLLLARLGVTNEVGSIDEFKSRDIPIAMGDLRLIGDMMRKSADGKGFAIDYKPFTNYTDLVQYVGFDKDIKPEMLTYAYEITEYLLSEKTAERIAENGAYPTSVHDIDITNCIGADLYKNPSVPNAFEYRKIKDALAELSEKALSGDEDARNDLDERLNQINCT